MSPALYLAVSNYTILCNYDQHLRTRKLRPFRTHHGRSAAAPLHGGCTSTDPTVALALQKRCRTAARER